MIGKITCKFCGVSGTSEDFKAGVCPNEECVMGRRRGRANKPQHIHRADCACNRCLENDAKTLEGALEKAWEKHNRDLGKVLPAIRVSVKESPVIGPYDGPNDDDARFVMCPMAIVGYITPVSRRRK